MRTVLPTDTPGDRTAKPRRPRRGRMLAVGVVAMLVIALAATAWHLAALSAYGAAAVTTSPTASRLASARLAADLEPWNGPFAWRAIALRGLAMLEAGDVDGAYFLVEPYSPIVRGTDATFVAIYRQIVEVKRPIDMDKAHRAHAEDPLLQFGQDPDAPPNLPTTRTP